MTTATFEKSIAYDRETRDFAARLNGELIGYFGNYSDAENALDQVAYDQLAVSATPSAAELDGGSDADTMAEEVAAAVVAPETTMVSIVEPGLVDANIQVWPHSTVELVEHQPTANIWYALLVDGRHHNLVMQKHTIGRDYLISALNRALGQVEAAIEALNPQSEPASEPTCPYCDDTGLIPNGSGTGDASGGWADTCECQDPEPPAPTPAPAPAPQPPYGPQRPFPLTDTAELAAELSAVEGLDLGVACALAAAHLGHITREAGRAPLHCRVCGSDTHLTSACPVAPAPARGYVTRLRRDLGW